ncbi:hypothetical protein ADL35_40690 [Streptomyces sp. NRRL WC-3753]|nr:hypothetical protein ADL35_40690 [Streptomyces sp. NRRL WC-3753]
MIESAIPGQVCPRALTRQARCPFRDRTRKKRRGSVTGGVLPPHGICTRVRNQGFMTGPSHVRSRRPSRTGGPREACSVADGDRNNTARTAGRNDGED